MIGVLSILTASAALAVSAAPAASAVPYSILNSTVSGYHVKAAPLKADSAKARIGGRVHLEVVSMGAGKDRGWYLATP